MSMIVFLGPSLPVDEARRHLDATFLPPCRMGDVYRVLQARRPRAIGIIDGFFEQTPAVWHKEILFALKEGVAVYGGGSMGALRAAELAPFGMQGVGEIFRAYAQGQLEDDDEVAVAHLPACSGYRPCSAAMVNIRHGLELARTQGLLDENEAAFLLAGQKRRHYADRDWQSVIVDACDTLGTERSQALADYLEAVRPDRKRDDAIAVLCAMAAWQSRPASQPRFDFEPTIFFEHLRSHFGHASDRYGEAATHERLARHVRLAAPDRAALRRRALLHVLVEAESRRQALPAAEPRTALARFRQERSLHSAAALSSWMSEQEVDQTECLEMAAHEHKARTLEWRYQEAIDAILPRLLKTDGRFANLARATEAQWKTLACMGIATPDEDDVESLDEVLTWYQARHGAVHGDLLQHVTELGFGSPRQFLAELIAQFLHERHRGPLSEPAANNGPNPKEPAHAS